MYPSPTHITMSHSTGLRNSSSAEGVVCRLCMKNGERALNIFISNAESGIAVWNVMEELLNIQVNEDDGLPDKVCHKCVRTLMKFREFKYMCIKSEIELKKVPRHCNLKNNETAEVNPGGSENWSRPNNDEEELPEGGAYNVICVPVTMVDLSQWQQVVNSGESQSGERNEEEEDLNEDESTVIPTCEVESKMRDDVDVKQEVDEREVHSEEENYEETYEEENYDGDGCEGEEDHPYEESMPLENEHKGEEEPYEESKPLEMENESQWKQEVNSGESQSGEGNEEEEDLNEDESTVIPTFEVESKMRDDVDVKQKVHENEVHNEEENYEDTYEEENYDGDGCEGEEDHPYEESMPLENEHKGGEDHHEESMSLEMENESQWKQEVNSGESQSGEGNEEEEDLNEDESTVIPTFEVESKMRDDVDVKQKVHENEVHNEEENYEDTYEEENYDGDGCEGEEDHPYEESMPLENEHKGGEDHHEESMSLEMENEVYQNSVSRYFPKINKNLKDISVENVGNGMYEIRSSIVPRGLTLRNDRSGQLSSTLSGHSSLTDGDAKAFRREICLNWKSNLMKHSIFSAGTHREGYSSERNPVRCRSLKAKRIYFCDECGKGCLTKQHLKKHSAIHLRRYKCEVCGQGYRSQQKLNKHSKMHLRPFKCEICGIGFNQKGNLVIHKRIHTGVKPFKCKCGKEFNSKGAFGSHSRFHCNAGT